MNCNEIRPLLTRYLLADLDPAQADRVKAHLDACPACQAELKLLEPTLALLSDALAEPAMASRHLDPIRRERVLRPRRLSRTIRWIGESHPKMAVAAGLTFIAGFLWFLITPAMMSSAKKARSLSSIGSYRGYLAADSMGQSEAITGREAYRPEVLEEIEETPGDGDVPEPVDLDFTVAVTEPVPALPTPPPAVGLTLAPDTERLESAVAAADAPPLTVQPAEFDSVAMVKSPVIMKGIYGNRTGAAREEALKRYGGGTYRSTDEDNHEIVIDEEAARSLGLSDGRVSTVSGSAVGTPDNRGGRRVADTDGDGMSDGWESGSGGSGVAAPGIAGAGGGGRHVSASVGGSLRPHKQDMDETIPILGDVPTVGRLFKHDEEPTDAPAERPAVSDWYFGYDNEDKSIIDSVAVPAKSLAPKPKPSATPKARITAPASGPVGGVVPQQDSEPIDLYSRATRGDTTAVGDEKKAAQRQAETHWQDAGSPYEWDGAAAKGKDQVAPVRRAWNPRNHGQSAQPEASADVKRNVSTFYADKENSDSGITLGKGGEETRTTSGDFIGLDAGGIADTSYLFETINGAATGPGNTLQQQQTLKTLENVRIPEVDFRQAKLEDIANFLESSTVSFDDSSPAAVDELSINVTDDLLGERVVSSSEAIDPFEDVSDGVPVNEVADPFAAPDDSKPSDETRVTFSARDISLKEALDIVTDVSGTTYNVDANGKIAITPKKAPEGEIEGRLDTADFIGLSGDGPADLSAAEANITKAEEGLIEYNRLHDIARVEARGTMESKYLDALVSKKSEFERDLKELESLPDRKDSDHAKALRTSLAALKTAEHKWQADKQMSERRAEDNAKLKKQLEDAESAYLQAYDERVKKAGTDVLENDLAAAGEMTKAAEDDLIEYQRLHDISRVEARGTMESRYLSALMDRRNSLTTELMMLEAQYPALKDASADVIREAGGLTKETAAVSTFNTAPELVNAEEEPAVSAELELQKLQDRHKALQIQLDAIETAEYKWQAKNMMADARKAEGERLQRKVERAEAMHDMAYAELQQRLAKEQEKEEAQDPARFKAFGVNPFLSVAEQAFSTFAIDVDTAAYTLGRNYMQKGYLPPAESVRTEEYVNFFDYAYKAPTRETFTIYTDMAPSKFGRGQHLLKIGVKGRRLGREEERQASLTFLIDTSGSMNQTDRLGLVQKSLELLVNEMNPNDRVAIVQYDSHARLVLEHTPIANKAAILKAITRLQCGGSTNLEEGMHRAYALAAANFIPKGENRVLLLSDGVANLGSGAAEDILAKVDAFRRQGITCSVFGFGMGSYDDTMLETLANKGDGTYAFIDSEREARRVFIDDLSATLNTIAADVKIQVEYNPAHVARYRQLGYENRQLKKQDFRNDAVDAGEVGSGQAVTALYELELAPPARPQSARHIQRPDHDVIATVRVRYRRIDTGAVEEIEHRVRQRDLLPRFDDATPRFKLAAGVAEFSEILRGSPFAKGSTAQDVADILRPVALELPLDYHVQELVRLVEGASSMSRGK